MLSTTPSPELGELRAIDRYADTPENAKWLSLEYVRAAMILAVAVEALQILAFPLFAEGAISPVDDVLDIVAAVVLVRLLGWQWEFLPSLAAELVPGVDLIPFWTLAVANVYRKWKQSETAGQIQEQPLALR